MTHAGMTEEQIRNVERDGFVRMARAIGERDVPRALRAIDTNIEQHIDPALTLAAITGGRGWFWCTNMTEIALRFSPRARLDRRSRTSRRGRPFNGVRNANRAFRC
jgi:hypothetical protein